MKRFLLLAAAFAVGLKIALLASLVTLVATVPARAQAPVCEGENIVERLAREAPETLDRIEARARAIRFGEGRFWRVSREGAAPSHLFGTMHVTDPRANVLPGPVAAAVRDAKVVALEIAEIADPAAMQAAASKALAHMIYMDGTSLTDRLDDAAARRLQTALADRPEMPWAAAQRMKPWVVLGALAVPACEAARKREGATILDGVIAKVATSAGVEVVGLESVAGQMAVLDSLPEGAMLDALEAYMRLGDDVADVFETTVALYETGRTGLIWSLLRDPSVSGNGAAGSQAAMAAFERVAIDARNETQLAALLPLVEAGNAFIAVGALHLPGETGLLARLEARGWTVERLD